MAQKTLTPGQYDQELERLQSQEEAQQNKLESSPTYFSEDLKTPSSDVANQVRYENIVKQRESLQSKQRAQDWYGPGGTEETMVKEPKQGIVEKGIDVLSQPLYGLVGAAKWATGKSDKGLLESIDYNRAKGKETFGKLLQEFDVPAPVSMPVGFAMDVILDPINVFTLGSAGIVGKTAIGAKEAGLEGARAGAKSSFLRGLSHVTKFIPEYKASEATAARIEEGLKLLGKTSLDATDQEMAKVIREAINPEGTWWGKIKQGAATVGRKIGEAKLAVKEGALLADDTWRGLAANSLKRAEEVRASRIAVSDYARELISKAPKGETFLKNFDYNVRKWQDVSEMKDKLINVMRDHELTIDQLKSFYDPTTKTFSKTLSQDEIKDLLSSVERVVEGTTDDVAIVASKDINSIRNELNNIVDSSERLLNSNKNITRGSSNFENTSRMFGEVQEEERWKNMGNALVDNATPEQIRSSVSTALKELSSQEGYAKIGKSIDIKLGKFFNKENITVGKNLINGYGKFIGIFKSMKVGVFSPASLVYATLGNTAMTHMAGIDITRPEVYKRVKQSFDFLRGKDTEEIIKALNNPEVKQFAMEFPTTFAKTFGFSYNQANIDDIINFAVGRALQDGGIVEGNAADFARDIRAEIENVMQSGIRERQVIKEGAEFTPKGETAKLISERKKQTTPIQLETLNDTQDVIRAKELDLQRMSGTPTGALVNELQIQPFLELKKDLAARAASGNKLAKYASWALDQSKHYERIDQSFRLGNFVLLTQDGLTEQELKHMAGWTGFGLNANANAINAADITGSYVKNATRYFRISPQKASAISNEIYMNYAAMPAAVRALRSLPVLGSPFFSFAYAMALKTGKTAISNPAAFNKVNFFLKELEANKSPLEKRALQSKYYSWYNRPGMVGLGTSKFFDDNPIYLNVSSMIPYYSMNMFMPSERTFGSDWKGQLASAIDNVPLMKDPVGQLITDYFIIPNIIRDVQPQNMWGGPLYPKSATGVEKNVLYPMRQLAESLTPSILAPIAVATPESAMPLLPSYQWRKLGYATRGQTPVGTIGKEAATSRTIRAITSLAGVGLNPMDLTYLSNQVKKSISK